MYSMIKLVFNRNTLLIFSLVIALIFGEYAVYIKDYTVFILGLVMAFSMSGIVMEKNGNLKQILKSFSLGVVLNYFLYGVVLIGLSFLFIGDKNIFLGFIVIAATPPGVAILPFTYILKGDMKFSLWGVSGAFMSSIILTPLIIVLFSGNSSINIIDLVYMVISLLVVPFIVSRLLLIKESIEKIVVKVRGKVVNIGFAIIIYTAIGINKDVFWSNFELLLICSFILFLSTFGLGLILETMLSLLGYKRDRIISFNLLSTIKSSGFAVVTAMSIFGKESAIPSAILSVFVLFYLLFLSIRESLRTHKP